MSDPSSSSLPLIGWREWIALPGLGIELIKAKVDTGAQTSAIHASNVEPFERDGKRWVRFDVHPYQRDSQTTIHAEAECIDGGRRVRSSSGETEERFVIRTTMDLFGEPWPVELTLTDRDSMGFRMLLGREAIRGRCAVDVARSFVTKRPTLRRKKTRVRHE